MFADIRTVIAHALGRGFPDNSDQYVGRQTRHLCRDVVQWMEERTSGFPADDARLAGYADLIACLEGSDPVPVPE